MSEKEFNTEETERNKAPEVEAEIVNEKENNKNTSANINSDDEMTKKIIFSLCYLFGILFFVPLLLYKDDSRAIRHANEGLVLLLFSVVGNVVLGIVSGFLWFFSIFIGLYSLFIFVLGIIGIVYVVTDQEKELPLLGKIKLIK